MNWYGSQTGLKNKKKPCICDNLRQRKDRLGGIRYSTLIMKDILAISETTVADLLAATPMAVRFFIDQGTGCAICSLARFCKLKEVITAYDLNEDVFLEELARLNVHKP